MSACRLLLELCYNVVTGSRAVDPMYERKRPPMTSRSFAEPVSAL